MESAFPVVGEIINHKDAFVMIKLLIESKEDDFLSLTSKVFMLPDQVCLEWGQVKLSHF